MSLTDILSKKVNCAFCGASNPSNSRFCGKCGKPLNSSITNACPNCGAEIKSGSIFCSKCGSKLTQSPKHEATVSISKEFSKYNIWMRQPDDFAQKFELPDINGIFTKRVTVEQGTGALFIQGGVYRGMLPPGQYNVESLHKRIIGLVTGLTTTVILVDSAEVPLTFSFEKTELRTKDSYDVGASGQLTAKISAPLNFLENYLKGKDHISLTDIENTLHNELAQILRRNLSGYNISELYGNAEISRKIEEELKTTLNISLKSKGLEITLLNCIGFDEGAFLEVQKIRNQAHIDIDIAKAEYEKYIALNQLETAKSIDNIDNKAAVKVHAIDAENEINKRQQAGKHELEDADLNHNLAHDRAIHDHQLEKDKSDFEQDAYEIERLVKIQADRRERKIHDLNSASIETLIYLSKDSSKTATLAKLELANRGVSLSPEQLLAIQAADSPEAAKALAAKFSADEQREFNKRAEDMMNANADRMERVMEKSLGAMGNTATARAKAQNPGATIVPGGFGAPIVVNKSPQNTRKCKKCGASLDEDAIFCNECGEKQD